ncbi:class I SAM-dependent methyltransferase [uncultured Bacteroides sp.]|uniref:class I SAM-dependent methyltransferase n=1 Tax=uncultured Bacteroides sp. TaxID=162156 RepID=UPI0026331DDB|nr:class I SAM-dependent methyltransferase [uncultured Bacteroides sp.]
MDILKIDICPLCGKSHFEKVLTCTDHYATGESFDIFRCSDCGFMFTQNVPDEHVIGRYYESPDYISHTNTHKGMMNKIYHWVRRYMLTRKARIIKRGCGLSRGQLLDIGTGTGYFSHFMAERGWRVSAIEKSPQARAFAKEHFGLDVQPPEALSGYEAGSFDVITLWHVMEHLQNLNETWEQLAKLLKDRGALIVAVPNPSSFDARYYKQMWGAYDVPRHLWHFTPSVMQQFGAKHGFKLTELRPMPFDAFYVSMLSEKYRGSKFAFLKGMLTGTRAWFASLIKKERSSSMIYVFRKK